MRHPLAVLALPSDGVFKVIVAPPAWCVGRRRRSDRRRLTGDRRRRVVLLALAEPATTAGGERDECQRGGGLCSAHHLDQAGGRARRAGHQRRRIVSSALPGGLWAAAGEASTLLPGAACAGRDESAAARLGLVVVQRDRWLMVGDCRRSAAVRAPRVGGQQPLASLDVSPSVLRLLAEKLAGRQASSINTRRAAAGFPTGKIFDTWDETVSSIPAPTQRSLATLEWIDRQRLLRESSADCRLR